MKNFYKIWIIFIFLNIYPSQALNTPSDFTSFKLYPKSINLKPLTEIPSNKITPHIFHKRIPYKSIDNKATIQRAWLSSTVIPGLGQIYNKQYWKLPIIYIGFGIVSYKIYLEHHEMNAHKRTELLAHNLTNQKQTLLSFTKRRIQECRRTRDLFIILTATWYILNILDAYASAHILLMDNTDDIDTKDHIKINTPSSNTLN